MDEAEKAVADRDTRDRPTKKRPTEEESNRRAAKHQGPVDWLATMAYELGPNKPKCLRRYR